MTGGATPLPWRQVVVTILMAFSTSVAVTSLFAFSPWMCASFLNDEDYVLPSGEFNGKAKKDDVARMAGLLAGSYMYGQLLSSSFWGAVADRIGRRPVLLFSAASTGVVSLAFGFSHSFGFAVAMRFLTGTCNSSMGICKTYVGEFSDASNQAQAYSLLGVAWGLGMIAGPVLGGFLSSTASSGLLADYPYLLPNIATSALCLLAFAVALCIMVETLPARSTQTPSKKKPKKLERIELEAIDVADNHADNPDSDSGHESERSLNNSPQPAPVGSLGINADNDADNDANADNENDSDTAPLIVHQPPSTSSTSSTSSTNTPTPLSLFWEKVCCRLWPRLRHTSFGRVLSSTEIFTSIMLYGLISFTWIMWDELLSVFCKLPSADGGLNFSPRQVSIALSIGGVSLIVFQFFAYPPLERRYGALRLFRVSVLLSIIFFVVFPQLNSLAPVRSAHQYALDLESLVESRALQLPLAGPLPTTNASASAFVLRDSFALLSSPPAFYPGQALCAGPLANLTAGDEIVGFAFRNDTDPQLQPAPTASATLAHSIATQLEMPQDRLRLVCVQTAPARAGRQGFAVIAHKDTPRSRLALFWFCMGLACFLRSSLALCSFTPTFIFLNNASAADIKATANGMGQAMSSLLRGIGPTLGGAILGWSISDNSPKYFPFDYHLVYIVIGVANIAPYVVSLVLRPERVNRRIDDPGTVYDAKAVREPGAAMERRWARRARRYAAAALDEAEADTEAAEDDDLHAHNGMPQRKDMVSSRSNEGSNDDDDDDDDGDDDDERRPMLASRV